MQPTVTSSQDALSQLQANEGSAQNPNDILANQRQQLGVNGAQDTVTGLRGAINNTTKLLKQVAPSVMGRTGNSLVTNAQAGRIIQNEQAPIAQNLTDQGTEYNQANEDLDRLEQRASEAATGVYTGQKDKESYLTNLYQMLYGKEQDAAKQAEATRQFDAEQARLKASSGGSGGGSGVDYDAIIKALSGNKPATTGNTSLRQQWQQEANNGDWNAQVALNYAGDDGKYDGAVNSQSEYDILKSLGVTGNYYLKGGTPTKTGNISVGVVPPTSGLRVT